MYPEPHLVLHACGAYVLLPAPVSEILWGIRLPPPLARASHQKVGARQTTANEERAHDLLRHLAVSGARATQVAVLCRRSTVGLQQGMPQRPRAGIVVASRSDQRDPSAACDSAQRGCRNRVALEFKRCSRCRGRLVGASTHGRGNAAPFALVLPSWCRCRASSACRASA